MLAFIFALLFLCAGAQAGEMVSDSVAETSLVTESDAVRSLREEMEALKEEMRTLRSQHAENIRQFPSRSQECQMPEWWKEFQGLKDELRTRKEENDALSGRLDTLFVWEKSLKAEVQETSKQMDVMNLTLAKLKLGIDNANVAFEVITNALVTMRPYETYKFDTVVLNNGGGYHAPTGIFQAPVSGTYLFWGNAHHPETWNHIAVVKEGVVLAVAANDGKENNLVYLAEVKKGEKVWFTRYIGVYTGKISGKKHASYGGCLIHAHEMT